MKNSMQGKNKLEMQSKEEKSSRRCNVGAKACADSTDEVKRKQNPGQDPTQLNSSWLKERDKGCSV